MHAGPCTLQKNNPQHASENANVPDENVQIPRRDTKRIKLEETYSYT
jgi:hypothetical protein